MMVAGVMWIKAKDSDPLMTSMKLQDLIFMVVVYVFELR